VRINTLNHGTPKALRLFAESSNPRFKLTMQQANASLLEPSHARLPKAPDDPGRVLLVEDDDSVRESMVRLLNVLGVSTASYASAEALLAVGPAAGDTCVVSDLKLPGISGLQLLAELRQRGCAHPVILITAYDSTAIRSVVEYYDVAAYLPKPLNGSALLAAIRTAIEPQRQPRGIGRPSSSVLRRSEKE
jgi:FixJ family two-component response regulator